MSSFGIFSSHMQMPGNVEQVATNVEQVATNDYHKQVATNDYHKLPRLQLQPID